MAWGLWNKIKNGFRKVGNFVKDKILKPVVNNVVKPFRPIIAGVADKIKPGAGAVVNTVLGVAEKISDEGYGGAAKGWASKRFGNQSG
jgi:hypothetical protein